MEMGGEIFKTLQTGVPYYSVLKSINNTHIHKYQVKFTPILDQINLYQQNFFHFYIFQISTNGR